MLIYRVHRREWEASLINKHRKPNPHSNRRKNVAAVGTGEEQRSQTSTIDSAPSGTSVIIPPHEGGGGNNNSLAQNQDTTRETKRRETSAPSSSMVPSDKSDKRRNRPSSSSSLGSMKSPVELDIDIRVGGGGSGSRKKGLVSPPLSSQTTSSATFHANQKKKGVGSRMFQGSS
jgi:hypothetical protein